MSPNNMIGGKHSECPQYLADGLMFLCIFSTQNNQFGFKKGLGCNHAIYTVRRVVENFVNEGYSVNLCSIDLSKAFDKVNHYALFMKLMKRNLPVALLDLLENWLQNYFSCIKWNQVFSDVFPIRFGVRQDSVLSPFYLFRRHSCFSFSHSSVFCCNVC